MFRDNSYDIVNNYARGLHRDKEELKNLLLSPKNLNSDLTHQFSNKKLSGDRRRSTMLKLPVLRQIKLPSSQSKSSRRVSKQSDELQNKVSDKTLS